MNGITSLATNAWLPYVGCYGNSITRQCNDVYSVNKAPLVYFQVFSSKYPFFSWLVNSSIYIYITWSIRRRYY